jgi:hypothetical protein
MNENIEQEFTGLCKRAYELDFETDNIQDIEPVLISILELIKIHPHDRDLFVKLFIDVFEGRIPSPDYLLPFCMRELKYAEIKAWIFEQMNEDCSSERFVRRMNYVSHIIHAFDDDIWEDAEMWPYYAYELEDRNYPATEQDENSGESKTS